MNEKSTSHQLHRTRNAILWMLSGFIFLAGIAILQFAVQFFIPPPSIVSISPSIEPISVVATIVNFVSIIAGICGILLIPVGLIVGIVKLSHL